MRIKKEDGSLLVNGELIDNFDYVKRSMCESQSLIDLVEIIAFSIDSKIDLVLANGEFILIDSDGYFIVTIGEIESNYMINESSSKDDIFNYILSVRNTIKSCMLDVKKKYDFEELVIDFNEEKCISDELKKVQDYADIMLSITKLDNNLNDKDVENRSFRNAILRGISCNIDKCPTCSNKTLCLNL